MTDHQGRQPPVMPPLDKIDEAKRETLKRIALGTAYAAPVVASFAIDGLTINPAAAQIIVGNSTLS
jgi:hypothetical protein